VSAEQRAAWARLQAVLHVSAALAGVLPDDRVALLRAMALVVRESLVRERLHQAPVQNKMAAI
jgi:hypothetical protein